MGSECLSSLGGVSECDLHDSWDPNPKRKEMDTLQTGQGGEQGQLEHLGVKCFLKVCWEMCQSSEADPEGQALGPQSPCAVAPQTETRGLWKETVLERCAGVRSRQATKQGLGEFKTERTHWLQETRDPSQGEQCLLGWAGHIRVGGVYLSPFPISSLMG